MVSSAMLPPDLARIAATALARLPACTLCARRCGADRTRADTRAACGIGRYARITSWGRCQDGSGAIVFAGCNLRCLYCPQPEVGWEAAGAETTPGELAEILLSLQDCHTVTLIRPSHVAAQILEALAMAVERGFGRPLAWDSNGYDSLETLALLDGIVALYRCDMRYGESAAARQCSGIAGYAETNRAVVAEMYRQVGRNLLIRHPVLPNGLAGTPAVMAALPPGSAILVTGDYAPHFRADRHPKLNRRVTEAEVAEAKGLIPARAGGQAGD